MVVFIGACVPLASSWRRKIRALVITLPVIHVLNVFRNAGIIWLVEAFPDWRWMGLDMFDFSHTYPHEWSPSEPCSCLRRCSSMCFLNFIDTS